MVEDRINPVVEVVKQFHSGSRRGALRIMREFLDGTGGELLETDYQRWRERLNSRNAGVITDIVQKDPKKERNLRGLYFDSALNAAIRTGVLKEESPIDH